MMCVYLNLNDENFIEMKLNTTKYLSQICFPCFQRCVERYYRIF